MRQALVVALAVLALALLVESISAQTPTTPDEPTNLSITSGALSLSVSWNAPMDDGGSSITAYDLQYMRSDGTESDWTLVEDMWTSGTLTASLTGLRRDTGYDIQLRAVNAEGDGPWSATETGATTDHSDSRSGATPLTLGSAIEGSIDGADDEDYFRISLASETDLWVYTSGPLDTTGYLLSSSGSFLDRSRDGGLNDHPRGFSLRTIGSPGIYYVKVESRDRFLTGPYVIHAQSVTDPGKRFATATQVQVDSVTPGRISFPAGSAGDMDVFEFTLTEQTQIWALGAGRFDNAAKLLKSNGDTVALNDDSGWNFNLEAFALSADLEPGTYYIQVRGFGRSDTGPYALDLRTFTEPSNSSSSPTTLTLDVLQPGSLSASNPTDYFQFTVEDDAYVVFSVTSLGSALPVSVSGTAIPSLLESYNVSHADLAERDYEEVSFWRWGKLPSGTYDVNVTLTGANPGKYLVGVYKERYGDMLSICEGISRPSGINDKLYGCQWHLSNSGQFPHGTSSMPDIGVEDVWDTTETADQRPSMGYGVNVAIVDDGMHAAHEDLVDNVNASRNYNYEDSGTSIFQPLHSHGTGVAGLVAADDNDVGVRGVAPDVTIYGYNLLAYNATTERSNFTTANEEDAMLRHMADTAVYNNSWGFTNLGAPQRSSRTWQDAVVKGVTDGFGGKGVSYIWSAGNGHGDGSHTNLDGRVNHYAVTAVCAVNYADRRASFSETGANLWVCAPSGELGGHPRLPDVTTTHNSSRYRDDYAGTSVAAPVVSGVVALMRAANADLTWRDVKVILANSARQNDPDHSSWKTGATKFGSDSDTYSYSEEYGFGVVDAKAAVELADGWTNLPPWRTSTVSSAASETAIRDFVPINRSLQVDSVVEFVEYVEINIDLDHDYFRDLDIVLTSPNGRKSTLSTNQLVSRGTALKGGFRFGSARHLGENPNGAWNLRLVDQFRTDTGTLRSWSLTFYGHGVTPHQPTVLSTTAQAQSISVTWQAPTDIGQSAVTKYDLRYIRSDASDQSDSRWTMVENIATDDTAAYVVTGLEAGINYNIQIRAHNDDGAGSWSETAVGNTTPVAPGVPQLGDFIERSRELRLIWRLPTTGQAEISRYDVRYIRNDATVVEKAEDSNWTVRVAWSTGGGELAYLLTGLENNVRYDVQMRAFVNGFDVGDWSSTSMGRPFAVNQNPEFPMSETGQRSIDENTPAGSNIGSEVRATDLNNDQLEYTLSGLDASSFQLVANSGQLQTLAALDHETMNSYEVTISVTDGEDENGESDAGMIDHTIDVTISVNDVNEVPVVSGALNYDFLESRAHWNVGRYTATDPEGDTIIWSLGGADQGDFEIDASGNVSFKETPDADQPVDSNRDSKYEFNVVASDGRLSGSLSVSVNVEDVDEPPVVSGDTNIDYLENATGRVARYTGSNPEGGTVNWSLGGGDASRFELRGSSPGVRDLYFLSAPDFEQYRRYRVAIHVFDGSFEVGLPVVIEITDVNETETLSLSSAQPVQDIPYTATLTEADRVTNESWQWERSTSRTSGWTEISSATSNSYLPTLDDVGYFLRVTLTYDDPHGAGKSLSMTSGSAVIRNRMTNADPAFASATTTREIAENSPARTRVGAPVVADDPDDPPRDLTYSLSGTGATSFVINNSGQISLKAGATLDHETTSSYTFDVVAEDPFGGSGSTRLTVNVTDINEAPVVANDSVTVDEDTPTTIRVLENDEDPEGAALRIVQVSSTPNAELLIDPDNNTVNNQILYGPTTNFNTQGSGADTFRYLVTDGMHSVWVDVLVVVNPVNDAPTFGTEPITLQVEETASEGDEVGQPVTAEDVEGDTLTYSLPGGFPFEIDSTTGQIRVATGAPPFDVNVRDSYTVTVEASDPDLAMTRFDVEIEVVEHVTVVIIGPGGIGGGGGGAPAVPVPSDEEFDWNVTRDIEELHSDQDSPTGMWSDGRTLWVLENAASGADSVFAYDLLSGKPVPDEPLELDRRNRFSHGLWSDGETFWVADSGQDRLFAYVLETGAREEQSNIELAEDNKDPRGIWADDGMLYVLDSVKDALFVYDFESGELLAENQLDTLNKSPRGIWSDGVTIWVSDDGAKRLFAYEFEDGELVRNEVLEFTFRSLLKGGNSDPRGIWSDGDVMYVADEQDDHIYTYNMPDAIDARLAALTLSGIEFDEFSPAHTDYMAWAPVSLGQTTVAASPAHGEATAEIRPEDADADLEGHQVDLSNGAVVTVRVTSADESRATEYRVELPQCLSGLVDARFSFAEFVGGSVDELVECAGALDVDALYHLANGEWVGYFFEVPEFLNDGFRARFSDGVPEGTMLVARRGDTTETATP